MVKMESVPKITMFGLKILKNKKDVKSFHLGRENLYFSNTLNILIKLSVSKYFFLEIFRVFW